MVTDATRWRKNMPGTESSGSDFIEIQAASIVLRDVLSKQLGGALINWLHGIRQSERLLWDWKAGWRDSALAAYPSFSGAGEQLESF